MKTPSIIKLAACVAALLALVIVVSCGSGGTGGEGGTGTSTHAGTGTSDAVSECLAGCNNVVKLACPGVSCNCALCTEAPASCIPYLACLAQATTCDDADLCSCGSDPSCSPPNVTITAEDCVNFLEPGGDQGDGGLCH